MRSRLPMLAQDLGIAERTLRRAITRGTVHGHRPAPRTLDVTERELAYLKTHWTLVQRLTAVLRTEPNVRLAVLFGSVARGEEGPDSDLDLLLSWNGADLVRNARMRRRLGEVAGRPAQLVELREATASAELMADIVRDGRVLIDRDRAWSDWRAREAVLRDQAIEEAADVERRALDVFASYA